MEKEIELSGYEKALNEFKLSEELKALVQFSSTTAGGHQNATLVVSTIYSALKNEQVVNRMIQSNQKLSESSDKHTKALVRATWILAVCTAALVLVGIIQIRVMIS